MRLAFGYFIGFLLYAAFLVTLDYIQEDRLDLGYNLSHALFVTVFVRIMFWLSRKFEKEDSKKTGQHQE